MLFSRPALDPAPKPASAILRIAIGLGHALACAASSPFGQALRLFRALSRPSPLAAAFLALALLFPSAALSAQAPPPSGPRDNRLFYNETAFPPSGYIIKDRLQNPVIGITAGAVPGPIPVNIHIQIDGAAKSWGSYGWARQVFTDDGTVPPRPPTPTGGGPTAASCSGPYTPPSTSATQASACPTAQRQSWRTERP